MLDKYSKSLIEVNNDNINWLLFKNDAISQNLIKGSSWEPHILEFMKIFLKEGGFFIDGGANFGYHSIYASKIVGNSGKVYSFEPQTVLTELMKNNVDRNKIKNIKIFNQALGETNKKISINQISYNEQSIKNMGSVHITSNKGNINCITLDSLNIQDKVSLIKLDLQGYEKMALQGSVHLIKRYKPTMIVEFEDKELRRYRYNSKQMMKYIQSLGYYILFLDYKYPSDHICIHKDNINEFRKLFNNKIFPHVTDNNVNHNVKIGISEKLVLL